MVLNIHVNLNVILNFTNHNGGVMVSMLTWNVLSRVKLKTIEPGSGQAKDY